MALKIFNTMTRKKEDFKELEDGIVTIYTCGPTVYNYVHIGNLRAFLFEDILVRYLRYKGYYVRHVMNITDVDDKTIRDSKKENLSLKEFTTKYSKAFFEDIKTLGVLPASFYPRATDNVKEMVDIIKTLMKNEYAYKAEDGSIYFSISKFKNYGKLSNLDIKGLEAGRSGRINSDEYEKDNISDFVLWKSYTEKDGDVYWDEYEDIGIPKGRPGWHIECSAMSMKYLGKSFDIHTGGIDNCFPHHENEIAQSECATNEKYVNYWMHCAFLNIDNEKMAKSAGNFYTLRDLLEKGYAPEAIRYALISAHYRMPLNFSDDLIKQSASAIRRIKDFLNRMEKIDYDKDEDNDLAILVDDAYIKFEKAMDDDLNISEAFAVLFNVIKEFNKNEDKIGARNAIDVINFIKDVDYVFNVIFEFTPQNDKIDTDIEKLIEQRNEAKKNKDYAKADEIRDKLLEMGIGLKDTKDGVEWYKI